MPRPKAHYSLIARNHVSGKRLKVELIDLPFTDRTLLRSKSCSAEQGVREDADTSMRTATIILAPG